MHPNQITTTQTLYTIMVSWNSSWVLFAQRCVVVALGLVSRNVHNELYLGFSLQAVTHCVSLLLAIALQYKVPNTGA